MKKAWFMLVVVMLSACSEPRKPLGFLELHGCAAGPATVEAVNTLLYDYARWEHGVWIARTGVVRVKYADGTVCVFKDEAGEAYQIGDTLR